MPPKRPGLPHVPAPGTPVGERLARIETLLEGLAERQQDQHAENTARQDGMETQTKEHRHRTANAMQEVMGRLAKIEANSNAHGETLVDILDVKAPAAAEDRKELRERLDKLETIVAGVKMSWKVVAFLVAALVAFIGFCIKLASFLGLKP